MLIFVPLHNFLFFKAEKSHTYTHTHKKETITKKTPNKQTKEMQTKNPRENKKKKEEFAK